MTGVVSVDATGRQNVDGLLSGVAWASPVLTYAMPALASQICYSGERDAAFASVTSVQSNSIIKILAQFATISNLSFQSAGVDAASSDLCFARTDLTPTAWAYEPSSGAEAGDVWFKASGTLFARPVAGSYGFLVLMHEIGHALGLKHGHDASGFGALPAERDSMEFSVMTYASYVGADTLHGYRNEATSYAVTVKFNRVRCPSRSRVGRRLLVRSRITTRMGATSRPRPRFHPTRSQALTQSRPAIWARQAIWRAARPARSRSPGPYRPRCRSRPSETKSMGPAP